MTAAELYLVRHGDAAGTDGSDPGLTERGTQQARALGARLANQRFGGLVHSPRRRAAQTAAILSESLPGVPVRSSARLDDRTPVPSNTRRDEYPERYWSWLDDTAPDERDEDGVLLSEAISEITATATGEADTGPLLAVTHAFVIGWFVRAALDAPTWRWLGLTSANTGLTIIRYTADEPRVLTYNDTGHLV